MSYKNKYRIKFPIILAVLVVLGSSCTKFLERTPPTSITTETFFKSEKDLEIYSNGFIQNTIPTPETLTFGDQYADNIATTKSTDFLTGVFTPDQQGGWTIGTWQRLRDINFYLTNISKVDAPDNILKHYEGVGRFWRAWFYYSMVKQFGDVPWYDEPIDAGDNNALKKGRDSREFVMDKVLEDLNFAAENCSEDSRFVSSSSRINRWTALAFKSRVCLFEGTYRKYHAELGLTSSASKFLNAAADAAKDLIDHGPFGLLNNSGQTQTQYRSLFTSEAVQKREIILANTYSDAGSRWHNITRQYNTPSFGNRWSLTKQFVNTYLKLDGTRFTDQANYDKMTFPQEVANRDFRLKQTIRTPGYTRIVKGTPGTQVAPDYSLTLTGYHVIKWSLDDDQFDTNDKCTNSLSVFRFGEVLLNYAEAKAELGEMDETVWNQTIKLLRERSGVNGSVPVNADQYLINYYNNQTSNKWILEVRRERGIELVLENLRYDDIMRWKLGELLTRSWLGVYVPAENVPYDMNSDGKNDVVFLNPSQPTIPGVYNEKLSGGFSLTDGDHGNLEYQFNRIWDDKMYLRPIPADAYNLNTDLGQNPGWPLP